MKLEEWKQIPLFIYRFQPVNKEKLNLNPLRFLTLGPKLKVRRQMTTRRLDQHIKEGRESFGKYRGKN